MKKTAIISTGVITVAAECSAEDFKGCKYISGGQEYEKKCDVAEMEIL